MIKSSLTLAPTDCTIPENVRDYADTNGVQIGPDHPNSLADVMKGTSFSEYQRGEVPSMMPYFD
jgi:hypothetical protein